MAKKAGLSKEDAKDEKKRKAAVKEYTGRKGKASEATISAITNDTNNDTKSVETVSNMTPTFVFYIARSTLWMIDSGCTEYITPYASDFYAYAPLKREEYVKLVNQTTTLPILGRGEIRGHTTVDGRQVETILQNVLHVPGIGKRFISTRHLDQRGFSVAHSNSKAVIRHLATG
jgi:hypothetical protein